MIEYLLTPFQYEYMLKAMLVSSLVGAVCASLSCFITLKGWSLMGDALSHAIVPGVSIAYILGMPFAVGAFVSGMLAAVVMGYLKTITNLREDAIIGFVFTTFFALGVLLISLFPSNISLKTVVFGNLLGIASSDILQLIIISAISLIIVACKWRDLVLVSFDIHQAQAIGLNVKVYNFLLLSLLAATAVAALQTVGACLVVAMLVSPGATAYLLSDRFGRMMFIAIGMGVITSFVGAYLSYFINGSTGGCIVVLQSAIFILVLFFAPKHGIFSSKLKAKRLLQSELDLVSSNGF